MRTAPERMSVIITTRNRGDSILLTIESLLHNKDVEPHIIVMDQSTNDDTLEALSPLIQRESRRIHYRRASSTGQSNAINEALSLVQSDVVALTDDDCEVPPDWLARLADAFEEYPDAGVIYCTVTAGPHDSSTGWVPVYHCDTEHLSRTWRERMGYRGMAAGMAARVDTLQEIGGFDGYLGAGSHYSSAGDLDVGIRALIFGWAVLDTNRTYTIHHGFRTMEEGRALTKRWSGTGAMYAKFAQAGYRRYLTLGLWDLWSLSLAPALVDVVRLRKPRDLRRLQYFVLGFLRAWRHPVDDVHVKFAPLEVDYPSS